MTNMIPAWDNGTLKPVEKLDVHVRGLRHKAISVFVMNGDEVLLQRRALSKYHTPGLWANTCCTHPHWNEDPETCARRRLGEELGIDGVTLEAADRVEYRADVGGGMIEHEVVDIFRAHMDDAPFIAPNPDEVMATRWIAIHQLETEIRAKPERFTPWLRIYMAEHLAGILGETA